jgi:hypothetical protein
MLRRKWILEFEPWIARELEPLMGWTSSRDPFSPTPRLRFPDRQSAIKFAERRGWQYAVEDPPARRPNPKSYADRFRYDLRPAISRAQRPWDGAVSVSDARNRRACSVGPLPNAFAAPRLDLAAETRTSNLA